MEDNSHRFVGWPQQPPEVAELLSQMQGLRTKATELFLREEWHESIQVYSILIKLCFDHISNAGEDEEREELAKYKRCLCLALSNRAEARSRLGDCDEALRDCDQALVIEGTHFKSLLCKGRILLGLNRYSKALNCFKTALLDPQGNGNLESLTGYVEKCKRLELQSRTGAFDLSDWVLNGFRGKCPELAEYVGPIEIKSSELSGRGLFATKDVEVGTLMLVAKAVAIERGILSSEDPNDTDGQLVMWRNFVEKIMESATKCPRIHQLISTLSEGKGEDQLEVPEISLFDAEARDGGWRDNKVNKDWILSILDVNSLVEDSVSAKVLGRNSDYYGVGLWLLASFVNHSCNPNARRLHVGDYILVIASRDVKAGEEITFAYFDVLAPLQKRKGMSKPWGFCCRCKRCRVEEDMFMKQGLEEIVLRIDRGLDLGGAVLKLEEGMKKWMVTGKAKGYLRASFWDAYSKVYSLDRTVMRRIPAAETVVDSVVEATGSDERVLRVVVERLKKNKGVGGIMDMERAMKLGKGVYGKAIKKQAMRSLLGIRIH